MASNWWRLRSNNIQAILYQDEKHSLTVVFINSQEKKYIYTNVPISEYLAFKYSEFPGVYLNKNIKGKYSFTVEKTSMEERLAIAEAKLVPPVNDFNK